MQTTAAVWMALGFALLVTDALGGRKKGKLFAAMLTPGKKGQLSLKLWPTPKKRRRRRKR